MKRYYCRYPNCNRSFITQKGLVCHEERDPAHNSNKPSFTTNTDDGDGNNNKKRHSIPYESSKIAENINLSKKTLGGPRYVDLDILRSVISNNYDNSTSGGDELTNEEEDCFDGLRTNDDEDASENICMTEIIHNIQEHLNIVEDDIQRNYILVYRHYQNKLYSQVFGVDALEAKDIQQFKDMLTDFQPKRLNILKCYLFAKSCNLSRNNGDDLLQLIRIMSPNPELLSIPKSWKSVTRAIDKQASYYTCHEIKIPFPEHWEMNKWNCNKNSRPNGINS